MISFWQRAALLLVVVLGTTFTSTHAIDVQVGNFEMSDSKAQSCDEIIDSGSKFSGDCCSLSNANNGGCILNIINGNCKITGQYWSLDWTSTLQANGAKCPESVDYPEYAPAAFAEETAPETPNVQTNGGDSSASSWKVVSSTVGILLSTATVLLTTSWM